MGDTKEFISESREAAIDRAAQHFGVPADELEVTEVGGAIAGLGTRVLVLASVRGAPDESPQRDDRPRRDDRRRRDEGPRGDRDRPRGDRDRGRERGDRDRDRDRPRGDRDRGARDRPRGDRDRGGRDRDRGDRDRGRGDRDREQGDRDQSRAPDRPRSDEPARVIERRELEHLSPTGNYVAGLIQLMGGTEGVEFEEAQRDDEIVVSARGPWIQELLRRDSRVGASLTHLAARVAQKHTEMGVRVRVDLEGAEPNDDLDLEPEEERLLAEVRELAQEVIESGEERETGALSSRERWLVHNSLREIDGVSSESTGEGREKRVTILPE